MAEQISFRAHARLLTMLGEQLIRNERIALVELVKNSYDADATCVRVDFQGFGPNFEVAGGSAIVISDNGIGMSEKTIRSAWMNPATPTKAIRKAATPRTSKGRFLQGEKGIGRFATFKLGNQSTVVTRARGSSSETTLIVDISSIDGDRTAASRDPDFFLEDLSAEIETAAPAVFVDSPVAQVSGTQIEIRGLRARWNRDMVEAAYADLDRMQPQLWSRDSWDERAADFTVIFEKDGADLQLGTSRTDEFQATLERAVLEVRQGCFDDTKNALTFSLNGEPVTLPLSGSEVRGVRPYRERFGRDGQWLPPECGSFEFEFFVFDFGRSAPPQYQLDSEQRDILRGHRIYLYRDGIRVYPYGDADDDWLAVDAIRGTQSARSMFSNDQLVGFVSISQLGNPMLSDKTNREGLLDVGRATGDFVALIQTVLAYLRTKPYQRYVEANRRASEQILKTQRSDQHFSSLRNDFNLPARAVGHLEALEKAVSAERELSSLQLARTEQLAGVGLSVETASHDLIAASTEALRTARQIVSGLEILDLRSEPVFVSAKNLVVRLEFISSRFKDVQGLFVSTRQKSGPLDIVQLVRRVRSMYSGLHEAEGINFIIDSDADLTAVSTEAAVLQCVINLVDNATYWLMTTSDQPRTIRASTPSVRTLLIEDNGPGVADQDAEFIFEPFYSGKGEAGKGLGLYIAKQNGLRSGFNVSLLDKGAPGASFEVKFTGGNEK